MAHLLVKQLPVTVKAVTKLNRGKRDGSDNFCSDHIINALPKLYAMLAMLINCMGIPHINCCEAYSCTHSQRQQIVNDKK